MTIQSSDIEKDEKMTTVATVIADDLEQGGGEQRTVATAVCTSGSCSAAGTRDATIISVEPSIYKLATVGEAEDLTKRQANLCCGSCCDVSTTSIRERFRFSFVAWEIQQTRWCGSSNVNHFLFLKYSIRVSSFRATASSSLYHCEYYLYCHECIGCRPFFLGYLVLGLNRLVTSGRWWWCYRRYRTKEGSNESHLFVLDYPARIRNHIWHFGDCRRFQIHEIPGPHYGYLVLHRSRRKCRVCKYSRYHYSRFLCISAHCLLSCIEERQNHTGELQSRTLLLLRLFTALKKFGRKKAREGYQINKSHDTTRCCPHTPCLALEKVLGGLDFFVAYCKYLSTLFHQRENTTRFQFSQRFPWTFGHWIYLCLYLFHPNLICRLLSFCWEHRWYVLVLLLQGGIMRRFSEIFTCRSWKLRKHDLQMTL